MPELSSEQRGVIEKMAETQHRNPELVAMVRQSHRGHPRYAFLFDDSPLHAYFLWRVSQAQQADRPPPPPGLPPGPPPGPPPAPVPGPESTATEPDPTRRYFELPAGVMVRLIDEDHREYTPLRTADLESAEFLESIAQGLSTFKDTLKMPTVSDELDRAMAAFEEGVRYIYKEGEFEDRDDPLALAAGGDDAAKSMAIDREGWAPGVLETVLWKRRQERAQRRREQQRGDDTSDLSSSGGSSSDSDDGSGSSSSGSPSSSEYDGGGGARKRHAAAAAAKPTSINRALGSDNLGFKLLAKLGWQEGQGLGAAGDGIVEPIRLQTRFSTVRQGRPGSAPRRGKGKRVVRPSLGVGRTGDERVPEITDDHLEQFRRQKSHAAASHLQGDDIDGG